MNSNYPTLQLPVLGEAWKIDVQLLTVQSLQQSGRDLAVSAICSFVMVILLYTVYNCKPWSYKHLIMISIHTSHEISVVKCASTGIAYGLCEPSAGGAQRTPDV